MFGFFKGKSIKKANLGEKNAFYFNEDLKRWVERGKEDEAREEAVPNEPPRIAQPVSQVVQATGIAAKYVDTGFGKPGAVASGYKAPDMTGPNGIKAPSPDMKFFVPTLPVTPTENSATGSGEPQGNGEVLPDSNKRDSPLGKYELVKTNPADAKIGKDPLLDIFGPDEDDTASSSDLIGDVDPLDEIFGSQGGPSSPQTDTSRNSPINPTQIFEPVNSWDYTSSAAPDLTTTLDSLVIQSSELGNENVIDDTAEKTVLDSFESGGVKDGGDTNDAKRELPNSQPEHHVASPIEAEQGAEPMIFLDNVPLSVPDMTVPFDGLVIQGPDTGGNAVPLESATGNLQEDVPVKDIALEQYPTKGQGSGENATAPQNINLNNPDNHGDGEQNGGAANHSVSQVDLSVTDFGWTAEETACFYQWMDENIGPGYKEWSGEEWNGFWQWYNNPVQAEYAEPTALQADVTGVDMSCISVVSDENALVGLETVVDYATEDQVPKIPGGNEDASDANAVEQPLDSFQKDIAASSLAVGNAPPGFESLKSKEGNPAGSMPESDEGTQDSPVTAEIRSDSLTKSNGSFSSGSQEIVLQYDVAHLHDFFGQLSDLLTHLTPGSDDIAKQQADCQEQVHLFMKSLKEHNRISPVGNLEDLGATNIASQDQGCEIKEWTRKLEQAEQETSALRLELEKCRSEMTETKEAMELMTAEHKEAQDHAVTTLRTELEQSYHHRLVSLQQELESKTSEIGTLQASRVHLSPGENSHQGGDLQKLREALEEMEISRNKEIGDLQYELDMKVAENDDIQHELDTLTYKITHGLPLGGELAGLVPQIEFKDKLEASCTELQDLKQTVNELEKLCDKEHQEVIRLTGSLDEANKNLASVGEELDSMRKQSVDIQSERKPENTDAYPPEKLMTSLGLAELQIKALSSKLIDVDVDVDALICQALDEFLQHDGRL